LVHGAVDTGVIVAVGDRIKLSTDALREADAASAYREDVRLFGEFWQRALMAASVRSAEIAAHAADPNPEARWTLAEIHDALEPIAVAPPLPVVPPVASPVAVSAPVAESPSIEPPILEVPPVTPGVREAPTRAKSERLRPEGIAPHRFPKWILAAIAGLLLLIFAINRPRSADLNTQSRVALEPSAVEAPVSPSLPKTEVPRVSVPPPPKPVPATGKEMWRVIAFTYRTRDAAAKKVQQLNELHPGIHASVFLPKESRGYYLVALGGRMTREDAVRLQHSARGKGLPRDLYVQNYTR
jgi:hypothetical protein